MEPTEIIVNLATSAVSLVVAYLSKGAKEVAKGAGQEAGKTVGVAAWKKATELYESIKTKFSGEKTAAEALEGLAKVPDDVDAQAVVRSQLITIMKQDNAFAKQVAILLTDAVDSNVDTVFHTNIAGDVGKFVQIGVVHGNVNI